MLGGIVDVYGLDGDGTGKCCPAKSSAEGISAGYFFAPPGIPVLPPAPISLR